ncbi:unnamed protein product, partial [Rotaria magnacalcarata]
NDQTKADYEISHQTAFSQTEDLIENDTTEDQVDAHISRIRDPPQKPEEKVKRKTFRLSSTTANIFTWVIRIVILVLQLDL